MKTTASQVESVGQVDLQVHDAGVMFLNPDELKADHVKHSFRWKNDTDQTIRLKLKHLSCGCAKCIVPELPVRPGEETNVELGFEPRYERGRRTEGAVLETGVAGGMQVAFKISADLYPRLDVKPRPFRRIALRHGESVQIACEVIAYSDPSDGLPSFEFETVGEGISIFRSDELSTAIENGVRKVIQPFVVSVSRPASRKFGGRQVVSDSLSDAISGKVVISSDGITIEIPITGTMIQDIHVNPRFVFLSPSPLGNGSFESKFTLQSDEEFKIIETRGDSMALSVRCDTGDQRINEQKFRVSLTPGKQHGMSARFTIRVLTDHPNQRWVKIPICVLF